MPPRYTVGPVPKEALAWFKRKGIKVGFNWADVWREEHAAAFTAAKVVELDVLADLRAAVEAALEEGRTFREFQQVAGMVLERSGWTNYHPDVPKVSRLKTIYDTNMRVARAAGQWQRIERTKEVLPYLVYELGPSRVHRPEHAAWEGLVLRVDDPFWQKAMPPNGFGCRCSVRQISAEEAAELGGVVKAPELEQVEWTDPVTGDVRSAMKGIGPGFDYNPGIDRTRGLEGAE